jgi:uncharacterized sporulation protein YeaH/YhbH (DUF444 family)
MERARDAVAFLQGSEGLTLGGLAESSMKRQVTAAERKIGGKIPARPKGESAGIKGRRSGSESKERTTYCARIDEAVREAWRNLAYLTREEKELAELFEVGLSKEIKRLEKKHGKIASRGSAPLRPGRKIK